MLRKDAPKAFTENPELGRQPVRPARKVVFKRPKVDRGKSVFMGFHVILSWTVLGGIALNGNSKYVRLVPQYDDCLQSWGDSIGDRSSLVCCPTPEALAEKPWLTIPNLCRHSMSIYSQLSVTLVGAWLVPLSPVLVMIAYHFFSKSPGARAARGAALRRLGLYAAALLFRTGVLYALLDGLARAAQPAEGDDCWYAPMRRDGRCRAQFDFSDHAVLYTAQYLAPQAAEAARHVQALMLTHNFNWKKGESIARAASLFMCLVISGLSLYAIYGTGRYFHTIPETMMGFFIASATVMLPLQYLLFEKNIDQVQQQQETHEKQ